jgi:K+-transporting ATPase ATPase C chain
MFKEFGSTLLACLVSFALCAVVYPLIVWGLAQLAFPHRASGSLIYGRDRTVIGSELIAQPFVSDRYFWPRPSAADYNASAAAGSNLGTKNPELRKKITARIQALGASAERPVPVDLVCASGSGLDPEITPQAAFYQVPRVAAARQLAEPRVRELVTGSIDESGSIVGAPPRVNVLKLNLALDGAIAAEETPGQR